MTNTTATLSPHVDWLYGLQHFGMKLGLHNIRALLDLLGRPSREFRTVIVAGTNGKGSVVALLDALTQAHGRRTGAFTSPHLVRPHERIRVDGQPIGDDAFAEILWELKATCERGIAEGRLEAMPSFFEIITAAALVQFRRQQVDVALLEVGLGGRLDATNATETDATVITTIGLDHTKTLGPTIDRIAREKAGVVRPGIPLISGVRRQRAIDVIRDVCRARGATYRAAADVVSFVGEAPDGSIAFDVDGQRLDGVRLGLAGRYQIDNARVALAALPQALDGRPDPDAMRRGLADARWRGRVDRWPAAEGRPALLFDAAHNPDGIDALVETLKRRGERPDAILFGTSTGKPLDRMLQPLAALCPTIVLTRPPVRRGQPTDELEPVARHCFDEVVVEDDPVAAFRQATARTRDDGFLLVTGSLYLVGTIVGALEDPHGPGPISF